MSRLLALLTLCFALAGCAAAAPAPADVTTQPAVADRGEFAHLLQTGVSYDFEPTDSPADAVRHADVVVVGRVKQIVEGRTLAYGRSNQQANMVVQVQKTLKGSVGDTVYVEVSQPSGVSIDMLEAELPNGRVILFLDDRTDVEASGEESGRPAGSSVYTPLVDGFVIESGTGWTSGLVDRDSLKAAWSKLATIDDVIGATSGD